MANIFLDTVQPLTTEIVSGNVDYAKVLQRLFNMQSYNIIGSTSPLTPTSSDVIYLSPGKVYRFYSTVDENLTGPKLVGNFVSSSAEIEYLKATIKLEMSSLDRESIRFVRPTTISGVSFSSASPKLNQPFIRFTGTSSSFSKVISCNFGSTGKSSPVIICDQPKIECSDCAFTTEGISLSTTNNCNEIIFSYNLNHGVARAIDSVAPSGGCKYTITNNTLDISGQLLRSSGRVLSGSLISKNVVENHEKGFINDANNGHCVYINGQIDGISILDNVFSGADSINGDTTQTGVIDRFIRRPDTCIKIDGSRPKNNIVIRRNVFRYPKFYALELSTPLTSLIITGNVFSGISNNLMRCACWVIGGLRVTNPTINSNMINSIQNNFVSNFINFDSSIVTGASVKNNLVCTPGETAVGLGVGSSGNTIKKNFETLLDNEILEV